MKKRILATAAALVVTAAAGSALASYPAGVWVKVKSVVFEPSPTAPTKIFIQGAAMLYDGSKQTSYLGYSEPALGSLYYECPKGDETTCLEEWKDIQKNIAEPVNVCVGLGDQKLAPGTLHPPGSHPKQADTYPIALGVLPGFVPCEIIGSFLTGAVDGGAGAGGASGSAGAAGTSSSGGSTSSGGSSAGSAGSSSGTGGSATGTGGSAGSSAQGGDDPGDDGGCSLAPGESSSSVGWMALAALSALALGRRSRK